MQTQVAGQIWVIPTSVLSQTVLSCSFLQALPGIFYNYFSKLSTKMWNCFGMGCVFSTSQDTAQCPRVFFPTHLPTGTTSASPHSHQRWVLSDFSTVWPGWWVWGLISYPLFNLQLPERWGILPNVYCPGCLHPALPIHICCPFFHWIVYHFLINLQGFFVYSGWFLKTLEPQFPHLWVGMLTACTSWSCCKE